MPTIIPITDFAAPELDIYARLTENQLLNRAGPGPTPCSWRKVLWSLAGRWTPGVRRYPS